MGGLDGGLEETVSSELGKASLKTMPCLRAPADVLAFELLLPDIAVGMDLGGDEGGDMDAKPRPM